ncbi:poly-beta-1,6-N-acetyl-D-glucosamine biosynthesis protein PgaD [Acinetobacter albensis]|uniref:Poly-beta-1,6-N-acetyl-D-glucosamine biosynthesis protein PgaD n=1 Tax=Acinetobacter albensis TaxID=1673609 RepID=A0A1C4GRE1_9GAMM|nr:poly-beta-1,6-N-acetyl-D-glucosamine biosynthesis protein PgaD [Acinetobacter albensis]SCC70788.1 poly-beta-1,6-N-acetyl-D-glucosamine biosynthesis protein PgaD [Acinetobacter albensis]
MKSNPLIIDLRHYLPWHKRYASNTSTAILWAVWLLLWRPVLLIAGILGLQKQHVFSAFGLGIEHGISALLLCTVILLLWSNYMPAYCVKKIAHKTIHEYGDYFNLTVQEIEYGQQQKVCVIHHDEYGKIVRIES